ncbi:metallophosphoesterase [Bacillus sp. OVS6]|nr:metallophosphoesterase [Bacillus sp. OVS6]
MIKYNPANDQLILLGDYIDRGPRSKETLSEVMSLVDEGAIALRGNHDQMFYDWIQIDNERNDLHFLETAVMQRLQVMLATGGLKKLAMIMI